MKTFFKAFFILFIVSVQAQIGINTTTPEAQLDITASNLATPSNTDGLLIPRVNAFPATNPTAAQQGMMVYLMVTSGSNTPGFYFWDNITTSWIGILSDGKGDKDWYKVGTTSSPTAITDDVYRSGKVGIGTNNPISNLHVFETSTGMTPNADALLSLESNTAAYLNLLSNTETGLLFGEDGDATRGGIIYNTDFMMFRNGGNQNRVVIGPTGNMAIGGIVPNYPLSFTTALGDKVSLWGSGAAHYGFGIQANLFQIHSASNLDDIAFGYGNSSLFTENVRFKGNGRVGIGTAAPASKVHIFNGSSTITPNGSSLLTVEGSGTNVYTNILSTQETGVLFGASGTSANGGIIYNSPLSPNSMMFRTGGNANRMIIGPTGNVAIGNFIPDYPLHFASVLGDKVSLWGTGANHYGFGIQNNLFQIHSSHDYTDIAFGYGSSAALTETMRIKGNGNVGIGETNPTVPLHFATSTGDKISLYGSGAFHYGFGVQGNLLQIHSDIVGSDIAFGYGSSGAFNENVRIRGNGNVGIGVVSDFPLQFKTALGDKISLYGGAGNHYGLGVQHNLLQIHSDLVGTDIAFGHGTSASMVETMRIKGTGEIGVGTNAPSAKLHVVKNSTGITPNPNSQIVLDNTGYSYMNLTSTGESGVIFGTSTGGTNGGIVYNSGTYTDGMSFRTGGNINRVSITAAGNTEINGFTKLGSTAPSVKMIKLTGTTATTQGTQTAIAHGLTSSKILSVNVLVDYAAGSSVPPSYNGSAGYEYDYFINAVSIVVWPKSGNSINILSKPIRILVTYEE